MVVLLDQKQTKVHKIKPILQNTVNSIIILILLISSITNLSFLVFTGKCFFSFNLSCMPDVFVISGEQRCDKGKCREIQACTRRRPPQSLHWVRCRERFKTTRFPVCSPSEGSCEQVFSTQFHFLLQTFKHPTDAGKSAHNITWVWYLVSEWLSAFLGRWESVVYVKTAKS